jgi:hypothetical protein
MNQPIHTSKHSYKQTLPLVIIFLLLLPLQTFAEIRYVSKTGSSTPPYTSWETAADSIQKAINICNDGDTVIVANGVYKESLIINNAITLLGSSMDSTVIDGTGLSAVTINFLENGNIQLFTIKGKGEGTILTTCILANMTDIEVSNCKLINALEGITIVFSSSIINQCIINNTESGYSTGSHISNYNPIIKNSIILLNNSNRRGILIDGGNSITINNIILGGNSNKGIQSVNFWTASNNIINNNIISNFKNNVDGFGEDTAIVHNNISLYASQRGFSINSKSDLRNNISAYNEIGTFGPTTTNSDYNLYWQNTTNTNNGLSANDIIADPMFVNDTIPVIGGSYDFHLQAYSPAIDAGDPIILDIDNSRSDIGAYGGPYGKFYKYRDLAPRPPVNLSGQYDSANITIKWNKNTEADFNSYKIFRDTLSNFPADSTTFILSLTDTFYTHFIPHGKNNFYYKLTAVDNQGNESNPSEEIVIMIVSAEEFPVIIINDYKLYQNYPNPFNPLTRIGYNLKESGYVKIMIYDIKGEMISVLVNEVKEAGYHEVEFTSEVYSLASGIYLYRIEVIGKGNIPVYSEMKKMLMIK